MMYLFPVEALARQLQAGDIRPESDEAAAMRCMRVFGEFNGSAMGVVSFSGHTGWECHPAGDELLYYLEGEAEIRIITEAGDVRRTVRQGDVVQIPRGLWHSQKTVGEVRLFFITPTGNIIHSSERPSLTK